MIGIVRPVWRMILGSGLFLLIVAGCAPGDTEPQVIYVTATPFDADIPVVPTDPVVEPPPSATPPPVQRQDLSPVPDELSFQPTADPPRINFDLPRDQEHVVRAGDTLYGIALTYGVSLDAVLDVNDLDDPNALFVGQTIRLPDLPSQQTPDFKILPDSRMVRGPGSSDFNIAEFVTSQPGYIRMVTDDVERSLADNSRITETLNASQIVERVALEYSVDPRLLLLLLEYRAGWLSNPEPSDLLREHPLILPINSLGVNRAGMYRQLAWAANQLNFGYYGWRYRDWTTLEFPTDERLLYSPGLNAGTVAVQYFLSLNNSFADWMRDVSMEGFYSTYYAYFGDPFQNAVEPLVPADLVQPDMTLPFAQNETWFYTGGWHGGWGSGSAWSAVDFAPPDVPENGVFCYVSQSWVRAVAAGVIARSEAGSVVLDLVGDGDESTGWSVLYLHIASQDRIPTGTHVQAGDPIGRASCEGGFSTATHLHIARRYNGEWIPADCTQCGPHDQRPAFTMSGWQVVGIRNQEYQGFLENNGEQRKAEQGRVTPINRVSW